MQSIVKRSVRNADRRTAWALAAALACAWGSSHAGTVMETESRDLATGAKGVTTVKTFAQAGRMRVEPSNGEGFIIFKDDAVYHVNPQDKTYIVMDRASMKALGEQINPALKQLQEQMKNMPPEQRAQIEKMMGGQAPGGAQSKPQQVRKTTRAGKVGAYPCSYAELVQESTVIGEACVAAPSALPGAGELMDVAKRMSSLFDEMMSSVDAPWLRQMKEEQMANFEKLGGIPVLIRQLESGKAVQETQLKSIRTEALAASLFETPAGYTRKEMMPAR